jgi:hypothetical protein
MSEKDSDTKNPAIAVDAVLGTGLNTKDINGILIEVGATVSFYTYTPDRMVTIRKVKIMHNELWAGEIPISMLKGERRNLQVIT